jgi:hypothetical protein
MHIMVSLTHHILHNNKLHPSKCKLSEMLNGSALEHHIPLNQRHIIDAVFSQLSSLGLPVLIINNISAGTNSYASPR